jgi:hypothetical protein
MVPSDLISSLALRGHAPHRALRSISRDVSPLRSPTAVFATRRINTLKHAASRDQPRPDPRNGLSLSRNGCSVSKPPYRGRSSRPATSSPAARPHCPFGPLAPLPSPVCPGWMAASLPRSRCNASVRFIRLLWRPPLPFGAFTPLRIRAQSLPLPEGPPSESARFPLAPRSPCLLLELQLRIIVPGSLRFPWLAVPQTSWNLLHYDPGPSFRQ